MLSQFYSLAFDYIPLEDSYASYDSYNSDSDSECDANYDDGCRKRRSEEESEYHHRSRRASDCAEDGDENCVCLMLDAEQIVQPYLTAVCYMDGKTGNEILVNDICPLYSNDKHKICHLNGCGDLIDDHFNAALLAPLILVGVTMLFFFIAGLIFILQITHNFRKDGLSRDWNKVRQLNI